MQLFFSIWEFRSQQISSSTENIYLVKTSVIFTFRGHRESLKTNFSALHLGGHGSSELLLFKSQWCRCHQRFQRDCIWSLCRLAKNLRIHGPMESPLSHQQLLTSIPPSLPTPSNGFFIEIHENIIKVAFFIEDDIWALEHDVCNLQSFIFCGLGKDLNQRYLSGEFQGFISW